MVLPAKKKTATFGVKTFQPRLPGHRWRAGRVGGAHADSAVHRSAQATDPGAGEQREAPWWSGGGGHWGWRRSIGILRYTLW